MRSSETYKIWYETRGRSLRQECNRKHAQTPKGKFRFYKASAKRRNVEFGITFEDYSEIVSKSCTYCGEDKKIGIDRRDNTKGYLIENSFPCCPTCNYMKKTLTHEEFLSHIRKIVQRNLFIKN